MTVRYVGPGGNDANDGLSWANRKLTLNGVEDTPVAAGDTVYVGPGTYRETLFVDVAGTSGNPITYIADVSGAHTDGVGGVVRITGSDDDFTPTRTIGIDGDTTTGKDYRTFRGFVIDQTGGYGVYGDSVTNWIMEDLYIHELANLGNTSAGIRLSNVCTDNIIRRCVILAPHANNGVSIEDGTVVDNSNNLIENCIIYRGYAGVKSDRVGGITVRNCTFYGQSSGGVRITAALTSGQTVNVYNSIFYGCSTALYGFTLGDLVEDYNAIFGCGTDRNTVNVGTNSNTRAPGFAPMILSSGYKLPNPATPFDIDKWSTLGGRAGAIFPTDDLYGFSRPAAAGKQSWGAVQQQFMARETTTRRGTSGASLKMADASRVQFQVPVTSVSTTFSVYVYREANYAGTNPQMIIKQPGQSGTSVTDASAAGQWNQLTTTLTPSATPGYVIVELVSNNTATSGSYAVFWDDLDVT